MKTLLLTACMAFAVGAFAQTTEKAAPTQQQAKAQKRTLTPEDKAVRALRMVISKTGLTDQQTPTVKQILLDRENAKEAARKANKGDKDKVKSEIESINQKADAKLQEILTPEQWKRWVNFKEEHKKKKEAKREAEGKDKGELAPEEDYY